MISPLAPRALNFSTPPSSPLELHPYLNSLNDLPPRSSNPLSQTILQGLSQTLPQLTFMDLEPSFPPINLSRKAIQNVQHVQDILIPPTSITAIQMPPPFYPTITSTTTLPPFITSLPPSSTFVPLDQSLWIEDPLDLKNTHAHIIKELKPLSITSKMK
ncbi:hypothetical protein Tco_1284593 [Tanacetum coccineum]